MDEEETKRYIRKIARDVLNDPDAIKTGAKRISAFMRELLQQEYRMHEGTWWLFSLGKPARPLTESEIADAIERGDIKATRPGAAGEEE